MAALEVTLRELTQWRSMQTDPHFGNYRIRPASELVFSAKPRVPPREMIFLDRKLSGMFFFLATLKAVVQARPLVERYLSMSKAGSADAGTTGV